MDSQLYQLSRRFPEQYLGKKGDRGDLYINHAIIKQRLIEVCGGYNFKVVREIYDDGGTLTGCLGELTVFIDGEERVVQDYGDVEHNQNNNGANAKHCASDAFKRCASHLGLGLHVWINNQYFLDRTLSKAIGGNQLKQQENEVDLSESTNRDETSNSDIPTTSKVQDQVDGSSPLSVSTTDKKDDEPTTNTSDFDKKMADLKKRKVEESVVDERTGQQIKYKYDK